MELLPDNFEALQNVIGDWDFASPFSKGLAEVGCTSEADQAAMVECARHAWAFYCNAVIRSPEMERRILDRFTSEQFIWGVSVTTGFHQNALSTAMKNANVLTLEKTILAGW